MGTVIAIVTVVGLAALAGAIALVIFLGKSSASRTRTTWLCVGLLVAVLVAFVLLNVTSALYVPPWWLTAALVVSGLVMMGLLVLIGKDVRWRASRVVAAIGLVVVAGVLAVALAMSGLGSSWVQPLFVTRAAQIAEANGFTALLPADLEMPTDVMPVEALTEPDAGLSVSYEDFWLQEREAATAEVTEYNLRDLVAAGTEPMGAGSPPVPSSAQYTSVTVRGVPAVGVEYQETAKGSPSGESKRFRTVMLVFVLDGVECRMRSEGGERESGGEWVPYESLSIDDLVRIAETFEPVE